jgi:UDP-N-acetylmuramate--alanine ligase
MHLFFSGIGGTGIGPLALIAHQAGYLVSGSDKQSSIYIDYLKKNGITDIHIGDDQENISKVNEENPIDWYIYSSAVAIENANSPELSFVKEKSIKSSKRDELLNHILKEKNLKLIAIAGTHGKSTTTAMMIWALKRSGLPISYSVGAKIDFGEMGEYQTGSEYFVYEADEFDRNFLNFRPYLSIICGVSWDHHEIFLTREDYQQAFLEFIDQSDQTIAWEEDQKYLSLNDSSKAMILDQSNKQIDDVKLDGHYNRLDAWLVIQAAHKLTGKPIDQLIEIMNSFPGLSRRMEEIVPGLYSDYAHTPEKIKGAMSVALEMAAKNHKKVVVIYEPLTNRRQHYIKNDYKDSFDGASVVYWLPSYLAREDPNQAILKPEELIAGLSDPSIAKPVQRDNNLKEIINKHLEDGDLVVGMNGGGGNSLDEWLRQNFSSS